MGTIVAAASPRICIHVCLGVLIRLIEAKATDTDTDTDTASRYVTSPRVGELEHHFYRRIQITVQFTSSPVQQLASQPASQFHRSSSGFFCSSSDLVRFVVGGRQPAILGYTAQPCGHGVDAELRSEERLFGPRGRILSTRRASVIKENY